LYSSLQMDPKMGGCCYPGCNQKASRKTMDPRRPGRRVSFHKFPTRPHLREQWCNIIMRAGKTTTLPGPWGPSKNTRVCSLHFDLDDIQQDDRTLPSGKYAHSRTKSTAVPLLPWYTQRRVETKDASTSTDDITHLFDPLAVDVTQAWTPAYLGELEATLGPAPQIIKVEPSVPNEDTPSFSHDELMYGEPLFSPGQWPSFTHLEPMVSISELNESVNLDFTSLLEMEEQYTTQ
jgi:hypothetical protein